MLWRWLQNLRSGARSLPALRASFDDDGVSLERSGRALGTVAWRDLVAVEFVTTDEGPFSEDVFLVLHDGGPGFVVPQGAEDFGALLERLQKLPGFENRAVIDAMGSTENARFPCWSRPGPTGGPDTTSPPDASRWPLPSGRS